MCNFCYEKLVYADQYFNDPVFSSHSVGNVSVREGHQIKGHIRYTMQFQIFGISTIKPTNCENDNIFDIV